LRASGTFGGRASVQVVDLINLPAALDVGGFKSRLPLQNAVRALGYAEKRRSSLG
jgi:hypothetical protein